MDTKNQQRQKHDHGGIERQKQGVSSFDIQDSQIVFSALKLNKGNVFLDLGCGAGDYAIAAAKIVGSAGVVYALDRWKEVMSGLTEKARSCGLGNVKAIKSDVVSLLPLKDKTIDVCLIAQVLHGLDISKAAKVLFTEIYRVLKPDGRAAIIEFKKEEVGFGPPMHIRLSPKEIEAVMAGYGFKKINLVNFSYSYLLQFGIK